jgi:hypothetical protein
MRCARAKAGGAGVRRLIAAKMPFVIGMASTVAVIMVSRVTLNLTCIKRTVGKLDADRLGFHIASDPQEPASVIATLLPSS